MEIWNNTSKVSSVVYDDNHYYLNNIWLFAKLLRGVMVIVVGYGHDDTSSNPGPG